MPERIVNVFERATQILQRGLLNIPERVLIVFSSERFRFLSLTYLYLRIRLHVSKI